MSKTLDQTKGLEILKKYTTKPNLIKHALAVAATMRHFAKIEGENQEYWATVGILHDIDYEMYPDEHCHKCVELLEAEGCDCDFIHAIQSHGYEICTDVEPNCYMEKVLSVIDQLTGFIIACALIKPEKKLEAVDLASMQKRWKNKAFAAGTERERIEKVCERIGKDLGYMMVETHKALLGIANELGL